MRLQQHINESSYTFETYTGKGFKKYDEMDENGLFIEKSGARRWHESKSLLTVTYIYDNGRMIGWCGIKYIQPQRGSHNYGKVVAGIVGVFVDPSYRGQGLAKMVMRELKRNIDYTKKTPVGKFMDKYKRGAWEIGIKHEKRISKMVASVFDDMSIYDEPQYGFTIL